MHRAVTRTFLLGAFGCACSRTPAASESSATVVRPSSTPHVVAAEGEGQVSKPLVGASSGAPVETAPPNVPEFKPAFSGQTRAPAVKTQSAFRVTELTTDLDNPWAVAFLPEGRMLVTEKHEGRLSELAPDGKRLAVVGGVPKVDGRDQGGLLDVALAPDYGSSSLVYLSYYEPRDGGNGLAVARARLVDGAKPRLDDLKVVFRMEPTLDSTKHAGGRLIFAPDGMLFVTLGERSILKGRVQARDLASDLGKIVRIRPDGTIPEDNPFVHEKG
ncbi:MAG TPA: PQQ-dependent sugar dehydrogenase, partial [Polyangiaceae bacterium]|nr:PQQ-dependent sugar dehydrogenase [Polyangiaceae bacterium]